MFKTISSSLMNKIPSILLNKYVITVLGLFLWLLILDETDLYTLHKYKTNISELKEEKLFLDEQIGIAEISLKALNTNPKELERLAREFHFMKKENEDLFVILEE